MSSEDGVGGGMVVRSPNGDMEASKVVVSTPAQEVEPATTTSAGGGDGATVEMEVDEEGGDGGGGHGGNTEGAPGGDQEKSVDFEPPQASVQKLIKRAIGESVQVGKEAKATFTRAAGIFILYLTACANDFCREGKRTTITVNDVYQALKELDFEDFVEPLRGFLQHHMTSKKAAADAKKSSLKQAKADADAEGDGGEEEEGAQQEEPMRGAEEGEEEEEYEEEEEEEAAEMVAQEDAQPAAASGPEGEDYDEDEEGDDYEEDAAIKDEEEEEDPRAASDEEEEA